SSSSWSGVHIHVTVGSPFTSSQTGTSSTAAESACIRPRRDPGWRGSGCADVFGVEMRTSCRGKRYGTRKIVERASLEHAHRAGLEGERHGVAGGECQVAR